MAGGPDVSSEDNLWVPHMSRLHVRLRLAVRSLPGGGLWLRCRGLGSWPARLCRTEFFKFGLGREAFGKVFLIFRQTRANQASVGERKTVLRHLFHSPLRSPALLGHAIGGDHHSGAVITYTAVNEDFLAWVFSDQGEKVRKNSVLRK